MKYWSGYENGTTGDASPFRLLDVSFAESLPLFIAPMLLGSTTTVGVTPEWAPRGQVATGVGLRCTGRPALR
jgi:hypothetical protein